MAKKGKRASGGRSGEKTAAVRSYLSAHPAAGPTQVVTTLKEQGIVVSAQLVSNLRAKMKKEGVIAGGSARAGRPKGSGKTVKGTKSVKQSGNQSGNHSGLLAAKSLVDSTGSIRAAREALDVLEQLRS